jgi:hypothetical protein
LHEGLEVAALFEKIRDRAVRFTRQSVLGSLTLNHLSGCGCNALFE